MDSLRRIVNNTVISLIGQVVTWTSTLILTIAYGRFLGDAKFGELYFAITFALLIGVPIVDGFNRQLTRDVAQEPEKALRYFSNTILIKIVLWFVLYGIILLLSWLLGYSAEVRVLVAICGITLLSSSITTTFSSLHYADGRVIYPVVGTVLEKGLSALIGFLLLKNGAGVQVMAVVLLGGSLASGIWQAFWFFKLVGTSFVIDKATILDLFRKGIPFLAYGVLGVIYYRVDVVLLSLMTNDAVVGWYGAAYRLFDTMAFLPSLVIVTIMYPVFSKLTLTSKTDLKLAIEKSMNFLLFVVIPAVAIMIVAAPSIIGFLYHRAEFMQAFPALQWLAPGLIFLYINMVLTTTLVSTGKEKKITLMAAVALVFNFGLNLILIPHYQHVGAALATTLTELLFIGPFIWFLPRDLLPTGSLSVGIKATIASLIMSLAIWPLLAFNIFLFLPIAICVYLIITTLLRTIPKKDLQALYKSVRDKSQRTSSTPRERQQGEEVEARAGDIVFSAADENTVPLKTYYVMNQPGAKRITLPSRERQQGEEVEAQVGDIDFSAADENTVPLKTHYAMNQHRVKRITLTSYDRQQGEEVEVQAGDIVFNAADENTVPSKTSYAMNQHGVKRITLPSRDHQRGRRDDGNNTSNGHKVT